MGYLEVLDGMDNLKKEVLNNREENEILRSNVRGILGEADYIGIYNFFLELLNSDYSFIILMSRRCLVLCQIFIIFFILDDKNLIGEVKILSDKAVPLCYDQINGKVAIVDDIIIHGRTIKKICRFVCSNCVGIEDIRIHGYKMDVETNCLEDEFKAITRASSQAYKSEWRNLSNKIVRCIFASNVPYTSFVTSYFQYKNRSILDRVLALSGRHISVDDEMTQIDEGLESHYFYEVTATNYAVFESLSLEKVIRLYWNKNIEKLTIIPYVFVKKLSLEDAGRLFDEIAKKIPSQKAVMKEVFAKVSDNNDVNDALISYKMRLLTCLLSRLYWLDFSARNGIEKCSIDIDTLEKSFGCDVAKELAEVTDLSGMSDLLNLQFQVSVVKESVDDKLDSFLQKVSGLSMAESLKSYFHKAWYDDELRAKNKEDRHQGITMERVLEWLDGIGYSRHDILTRLVNIWDTGIAAGNFAVDEKRQFVGCFNTGGEQSYRVILEEYPFIMESLIKVSKLVRKGDVKENETIEQYRTRLLISLLDKLKSAKDFEGYEDIKNIIEYEEGYLNAWNQVVLIDRALERNKESAKEFKYLVNDFIDNNF